MRKISMEAFITSHFVRYERLAPLINQAFNGSSATELNIFIDMYSIVKSLYSESSIVDVHDYSGVISNVINMCAHYREFFRRYLGVHTIIYIVNSDNCSDVNRKLISGYNEKIYSKIIGNKMMRDLVKYNTNLMSILCPYLPDIHFINSEYEVSVVISHIIDKNKICGNNNPNLIISRDIYNLQLPVLYDDTVILRSMKSKGEDTSFIVGPIRDDNIIEFWNSYADINMIKRDDILIHPINLSLLMAMTRLPDRNLKSVMNISTAKKYIQQVVQDNNIKCSVQSIFDNVNVESKYSEGIIMSRYKAIDIPFQRSIYDNTVESKLLKFRNLYDPGAVKEINNRYFTDNPLDLEKL